MQFQNEKNCFFSFLLNLCLLLPIVNIIYLEKYVEWKKNYESFLLFLFPARIFIQKHILSNNNMELQKTIN